MIKTITLRSILQRAVEGPAAGVKQQDLRSFELILEYIKALPVSYFRCFYVFHFDGHHLRNVISAVVCSDFSLANALIISI